MQSRMRRGRTGSTARRAVAAAVLGGLAVLAGSVVSAPTAGAAPTATVEVKDLTPPLVSIDPGGTVTFVDKIQDKNVQVGGGGLIPSVVTVVVHTDVTLGLPSGQHPLKPGEQWQERFDRSCLTCTITYTYRAEVPNGSIVGSLLNTLTGQALATLPQNQVVTYNGKQTTVTLGVPTPFLVNTILPNLPNLPSVNLPQLPAITVPAPGGVTLPAPGGTTLPTAPGGDVAPGPGAQPQSVGGSPYSYGVPSGAAAQLLPTGDAGAALDLTRFSVPGRGEVGMSGSDSGSGGVAGSYDGAQVPTFGRLAGLGNPLDESGEDVAVASDGSPLPAPGLAVPGLLAVIALAGSSSALVKARRAQRAGR